MQKVLDSVPQFPKILGTKCLLEIWKAIAMHSTEQCWWFYWGQDECIDSSWSYFFSRNLLPDHDQNWIEASMGQIILWGPVNCHFGCPCCKEYRNNNNPYPRRFITKVSSLTSCMQNLKVRKTFQFLTMGKQGVIDFSNVAHAEASFPLLFF